MTLEFSFEVSAGSVEVVVREATLRTELQRVKLNEKTVQALIDAVAAYRRITAARRTTDLKEDCDALYG